MNHQIDRQITLKIQCPDRPGIIAAVTQTIAASGSNIIDLSQHTSTDIDMFFLRAVIAPGHDFDRKAFDEQLSTIGTQYQFESSIHPHAHRPKVSLLVSKTSHCLYELLIKHREGELACDFPCIISNHPDLALVAAQFGVPFYHVPTTAGKAQHEAQVEDIIRSHGCELIVLARYMQILSENFTNRWPLKILNIHHGFLPAFKGAKPYHQAWSKGVKIIGATAHFANEDLDQGPIVAQDILRVSDRSSIDEFVQMGKDVERKVILQGLKRVLGHKVFYAAGRTFIID